VNRRLFVGTKKGLFTFRSKGKGDWRQQGEPAFLGVPVSLILQDPRDGAVYAALDHGHFGVKLHRSDDGHTWTEVQAPRYPALPEGSEPEKDAMGRPWPWTLKLIWSLEIDPQQEGALWCGTVPGGLFRSVDRGGSWELVRSLWDMPQRKQWVGGGMDLPGIHSICVDPRDPAWLSIGVSCGGVWQSKDGGSTWTVTEGMRAEYMPEGQQLNPVIQDPHRVVQCRAEPQRLWTQHHNGIFRTRKDGATWQEVKGKARSRFGFAVAVHPDDPDVAWFVPAVKDECRVPVDGRFCVQRTRDGGKSFDVIDKGLPKDPSYDLVYRHGLDITADGKRLAMGSTTGGLWVSDNGGKAWDAMPMRLPPVYCLRWSAG
jgi:hypothetical protein